MGKSRRGKEVTTKAVRNYSAYNSTNYLISPTESSATEEYQASSAERNGESEDGDDKEEGAAVASRGSAGEESLSMNKHALYQRAVQKPRGDISYLQKFFLNYIGGRKPLHLREDFCGTALICAEWVRGDARRTAVGLDLDEEALSWGLQQNVISAGSDAYNRVYLFCGDVINPLSKAQIIRADPSHFPHLSNGVDACPQEDEEGKSDTEEEAVSLEEAKHSGLKQDIPAADMICAFNYSCCCIRKRADLIRYFSEAFKAISKDGGVFAVDLYGGVSSECSLKLRRRFDDFQYTWEQEDFDVVNRTTRISLHFKLSKQRGVLRHAFSYHWRLWTLPEVKECLEEAGFQSVHFWIREMPDLQGGRNDSVEADSRSKYEEVEAFSQEDAWNAYIVAVAPPKSAAKGGF